MTQATIHTPKLIHSHGLLAAREKMNVQVVGSCDPRRRRVPCELGVYWHRLEDSGNIA